MLDSTSPGRPMRFVAWFGGSHDDTTLKLEAALDGRPLTCGAGSTTSRSFEDGTVFLDCRFDAPANASLVGPLRVALTVNHAQFMSSSLDAE